MYVEGLVKLKAPVIIISILIALLFAVEVLKPNTFELKFNAINFSKVERIVISESNIITDYFPRDYCHDQSAEECVLKISVNNYKGKLDLKIIFKDQNVTSLFSVPYKSGEMNYINKSRGNMLSYVKAHW